MKRHSLPLILLVLLAVSYARRLQGQVPDPLIAAARPAVVRVEVRGQDSQGVNRENSGSGFFISSDGYILASAHVLRTEAGWAEDVNGQAQWNITEVSTSSRTWSQATLLYFDSQTDLALLRVDTSGGPVNYLELGDSALVPDGAHVAGFGYDSSVVVYRGSVGMAFDPRYLGVFRLQITAQRGDSGGPVIAESGKVIGVIRAGLTDRLGRTYATPINLASNIVQLTRSPNVVADSMRATVPVGVILPFYGNPHQAPPGYLPCDGSEIRRADYPELYAHLVAVRPELRIDAERSHLPDLRGEFLRGVDADRGIDPNRAVGSSQGFAIESHGHELSQRIGVSGGWAGGWGGVQDQRAVNSPGDGPMRVVETGQNETRPRNVAVAFIIRALAPRP